MTVAKQILDERALLDATRKALSRVSEGLDPSAVRLETPLAALVFDSLMAVNFIASLESSLGVQELPFERWLAEHSERTDALTVGSLVHWLQSMEVGPGSGSCRVGAATGRPSSDG